MGFRYNLVCVINFMFWMEECKVINEVVFEVYLYCVLGFKIDLKF